MATQAARLKVTTASLIFRGRRIGARGACLVLTRYSSSSSAVARAALALSCSPWPSPSPHLSKARLLPAAATAGEAPAVVEDAEGPPSTPSPVFPVVVWSLLLGGFCCLFLCWTCGPAQAAASAAADDSIRASGIGLKVAAALRRSGWADEAVVFFLATLPVIELRGAIPVGYWMQLPPLKLTVLSILGNMVPVPFIVLYLRSFASLLSERSGPARRLLELLFERAREKAAPVEEFQWLGLMLFVAVPFPGTGAWTGAIIAAVLGMPFWSAVSANFLGVVFAGLLGRNQYPQSCLDLVTTLALTKG